MLVKVSDIPHEMYTAVKSRLQERLRELMHAPTLIVYTRMNINNMWIDPKVGKHEWVYKRIYVRIAGRPRNQIKLVMQYSEVALYEGVEYVDVDELARRVAWEIERKDA